MRLWSRCVAAIFFVTTVQACAGDEQAPEDTDVVDTDTSDTDTGGTTTPVQGEFDDLASATRCPVDDDGTNCLERRANAFRVDDEAKLGWEAADYDDQSHVLSVKLKPGATMDPRFEEGAFLFRGRKDRTPLMHKITGVRTQGDRFQIQMERANVKDVFTRGRIRTRIPLGRTPSNLTGRDGLPMAMAPAPAVASIGVDDCSGNVFDTTVATVNAHGTIKMDLTQCSFHLSAWVDAVLIWDNAVNVDRLEMSVGGGMDASLHAALIANLDAHYGLGKTLWNGPEIPVSIGGLIITINPSLIGGYDFTAAAELTVTHGFDYSGSVTEGFGWSDRRGWYSIDERESEFTKFGPEVYFDGNLTARVYLKPRLDVKAFGIVGGFIAVEGFAKASLTSTASRTAGGFDGEVCADLSVGLEPSIGAICEIPVVNITLFEEEVALPAFTKKLVDDACTSWTGPAPTDCDASSGCCTDGECPPNADDPSLTVQCERGAQVSGGKYRYSCETKFPSDWCVEGSEVAGDVLCDDGNDTTVDECVENTCYNTYPLRAALEELDNVAACPSLAVDCCFVDTDCTDGIRTTVDRCEKDAGAALNDRGTCVHEVGEIPRF